jgi:biotin operon repressor
MVLQMVSEGVSGARLAARLGISRVRASRRIKSAKAREEKRRA